MAATDNTIKQKGLYHLFLNWPTEICKSLYDFLFWYIYNKSCETYNSIGLP